MNDLNIGIKICEIRKKQDLSIRDLAKLAGVTPSLLSQIERGLANPSVNSLKSIASALNVPLFTFFMSEVDKRNLIVRKDNRKKVILPGNNDVVYEVLSPEINDNFEFAIMNLSPNTSSCSNFIEHKGYEIAYILSGEANLYIDEDKFTLYEGDSVKVPIGSRHRWENITNNDTKVIFAVIL
ncbi:helix-turn-helix domain-containing protein [Romboutsia sp. 1001216sp1]|uniref:helix-turn-helix domain-containing protein n=1 Tax=unclassified Romboutsia TaxID=2626894 RepID=UPI0018AAB623|nr:MULTISPECIES: helix-turn-helix domain-containing protein [unclassified Romboutsia]MDB8793582.1 helix-turn-helix domain-containing protein [Romboutsia sp. 1001216sp1]MDB8794979.1 helix-turn-helix domain-containing protein [Romboutsia sp. 1001216sp1]MDB8798790.1 helix-turn-helix domain-containing protein [Romboutsia sp. 1001216sp1]